MSVFTRTLATAALAFCMAMPAGAASALTLYVNSPAVNMRSGPGTDSGVIAALPYRTPVTVVSTSGRWSKVKTKSGRVGYVYRTYMSNLVPIPAPPGKRYTGGHYERVAVAKQQAAYRWLDTKTHTYHTAGCPAYGKTAGGGYVPVAQAKKLAKPHKCTK